MVFRSSDVTATTVTSFKELYLDDRLCKALSNAGYDRPSPVQEAVLPLCLSGADLIVQATSGTGKTVVISCSCLNKAREASSAGQTVALVVAPTRELAVQIQDVTVAIGRHWCPQVACHSAIGGMPIDDDRRKLRRRRDVVVGTPGRLLALLHSRDLIIASVTAFVMDEADRLLGASMYDALAEIYEELPHKKQVVAVSATFDDDALQRLLPMMKRPSRFDVRQSDRAAPLAVRHLSCLVHPRSVPPTTTSAAQLREPPSMRAPAASLGAAAAAAAATGAAADGGGEDLGGVGVEGAGDAAAAGPPPRATGAALEAEVEAKAARLLQLLRSVLFNQAVVFCNDAAIAPALTAHLAALGAPTVHVSARLPQPARLAALAALRSLAARVAVTSDVLARGVDLEYVNLVVNFDLPRDGATYAHRLGRAGRFGAAAVAVTLVTGEAELATLHNWAATCGCGEVEAVPDVIPPDWYYRKPEKSAAAALAPLDLNAPAAAAARPAGPAAMAHIPPHTSPHPMLAQTHMSASQPAHGPRPPGQARMHGLHAQQHLSLPEPPQLRVPPSAGAAAAWDAWTAHSTADMQWLVAATRSWQPPTSNTTQTPPETTARAVHACGPVCVPPPVQRSSQAASLCVGGTHLAHAQTGGDAGSGSSKGASAAAAVAAVAAPAAWLLDRVLRGSVAPQHGASQHGAGVHAGSCAVDGGRGGDAAQHKAERWAKGVVAEGCAQGEPWLRALEVALVQQRLQEACQSFTEQAAVYAAGS
eukprot:jgi/Ulvmu1/3903/UM018_0125.1